MTFVFTLHVYDKQSKVDIEGAYITATPPVTGDLYPTITGYTDFEGNFTTEYELQGLYLVVVTHSDYETWDANKIVRADYSPGHIAMVALSEPPPPLGDYDIDIEVYDSDDQPITNGFAYRMFDNGTLLRESAIVDTHEHVINIVREGSHYRIEISKADYRRTALQGTMPAHDIRLEFIMYRTDEKDGLFDGIPRPTTFLPDWTWKDYALVLLSFGGYLLFKDEFKRGSR